jgi:RecA-family ATPase
MMNGSDPKTFYAAGNSTHTNDESSSSLKELRRHPHLLSDQELSDFLDQTEPGTETHKVLMREKARRVIKEQETKALPEDVVPLFGFDRPEPMQWTVAGLVPEGHLTMLIADGGTGKSYLAIHLALCIASGRTFLGRGVRRGHVLYIDHELDEDEQRRRVWRVAEGMDLNVHGDAIKDRLFYTNPTDPLGTKEHHASILRAVERLNIDFIVLDSLTMGATGDVKDQSDFVPIAQQIRQWPTTLAIDHVSHSTAQGSAAKARAFGTVFKRNSARSSLTLAKSETGGFVLQQEKSNFNAGDNRLYFAVDFSDDEVSFTRIDESHERAAGLLGDLSSKDVTSAAVKDIYDKSEKAVTPEDVVAWRNERDECTSIAKKTVSNHFTALKKRGDVTGGDDVGVIPSTNEREFGATS